MNQSNHAKIKRGVQEPNLGQLRQICRILHSDPRYLLELDKLETLISDDRKLPDDIKAFIRQHSPDN